MPLYGRFRGFFVFCVCVRLAAPPPLCGLVSVKKRRPPPTHPHLKIVDNSRLRPAPKVAVSRVFQGFSRRLPPHPALSRISQISCLPTLGLGAGEIAVYAYLRCLENPSTYQCWPSYATIGKAIGRTKNTVMQYVDALSEKGLISTEPTSVLTKSRIKKNGNLCYTIRPIHEAVEIFHTRQLSAVERTTERRQIHRKLSAVNLLSGA